MKKVSTYLFLIFFSFQTSSLPDDIRDFQIEGISIGDSLLDYFSEEEIKHFEVGYYKKDKTFNASNFSGFPFFKVYDVVQVHFKNNKKYIIYGISGIIYYKKNINDCYKRMDKIANDLSNLFKNARRDDRGTEKLDIGLSKDSKVTSVVYWLKSSEVVSVACYDWAKEDEDDGETDILRVTIDTAELNTWLVEKAY